MDFLEILEDYKKYFCNKMCCIETDFKNMKFIHEIFYKKSVNLCIVDKDIISNTMKLNIIIYKDKGHEVIVLGLKKSIKNNIYYLATLHKTYENKYKHFRKTKIKNIFWVE